MYQTEKASRLDHESCSEAAYLKLIDHSPHSFSGHRDLSGQEIPPVVDPSANEEDDKVSFDLGRERACIMKLASVRSWHIRQRADLRQLEGVHLLLQERVACYRKSAKVLLQSNTGH